MVSREENWWHPSGRLSSPKRFAPTRVRASPLIYYQPRSFPCALARDELGSLEWHRAVERSRTDRPADTLLDCSHRGNAGVHLHDDVVANDVGPRAGGVRSSFDVLAVEFPVEGRHDGAESTGANEGSGHGYEDGNGAGGAGLAHARAPCQSRVRLVH